MKPASVLLDSTPESAPEAARAPSLLVDLPAWHKVFFQNLFDQFRPPEQAPLRLSSPPGSFWSDVFVTSHLPLRRFGQSLLCHLAAIVALWTSVRLWPQRPEVAITPDFNRADVIYYAPTEYLPPLNTGGSQKQQTEKADPEYAPQAIISVPPEADNRSQTIVTPSDVKLNHDVALPNVVAWSQAQPAVPLASTSAAATNLRLPALSVTVVAPAPETMPANTQRSASLTPTVVAPAPEITAQSSVRDLQTPQPAIIGPAPQVDASSSRKLGELNIGHSEVVAPAPVLPLAEQYSVAGGSQTAFGSGGAMAVPPPPSIPGSAGSGSDGRLISLGIHPVASGVSVEMPGGNRRGTFAATPAGKTGATGTPDVSANAGDGSGSGSDSGKNNHLPSGLTVGAAPNAQSTSAVAGKEQGSGGGGTTLMADATPPRVSATPPRALSEVSGDKATDVDHWIFGDRKFYNMTLNMPNLNSAGGSWVIRFAELNEKQEEKGELTAPVATQKVDPAYPLALMRRNVQGTVTLYAIIRNDGSVTDVRVLRGVDDQLDQYARTALAHWRFRPATKNGAAVDLEAVVLIPFKPVRGKSGF